MISRLCSIYSSVTGSLSFIWLAKLTAAKLHTNFNHFPTRQCLFTHRQCLIRETQTLERWMIWTSGPAYSLTECYGNFGGQHKELWLINNRNILLFLELRSDYSGRSRSILIQNRSKKSLGLSILQVHYMNVLASKSLTTQRFVQHLL